MSISAADTFLWFGKECSLMLKWSLMMIRRHVAVTYMQNDKTHDLHCIKHDRHQRTLLISLGYYLLQVTTIHVHHVHRKLLLFLQKLSMYLQVVMMMHATSMILIMTFLCNLKVKSVLTRQNFQHSPTSKYYFQSIILIFEVCVLPLYLRFSIRVYRVWRSLPSWYLSGSIMAAI